MAGIGAPCVTCRVRFAIRDDVILAHECCPVACCLQKLGKQLDTRRKGVHYGGGHSHVPRIASREKCRAAGSTPCWRKEVGEMHSVTRESVDVRRLDEATAHVTEIAIAKVICHDDDHVRLSSGRLTVGAKSRPAIHLTVFCAPARVIFEAIERRDALFCAVVRSATHKIAGVACRRVVTSGLFRTTNFCRLS